MWEHLNLLETCTQLNPIKLKSVFSVATVTTKLPMSLCHNETKVLSMWNIGSNICMKASYWFVWWQHLLIAWCKYCFLVCLYVHQQSSALPVYCNLCKVQCSYFLCIFLLSSTHMPLVLITLWPWPWSCNTRWPCSGAPFEMGVVVLIPENVKRPKIYL